MRQTPHPIAAPCLRRESPLRQWNVPADVAIPKSEHKERLAAAAAAAAAQPDDYENGPGHAAVLRRGRTRAGGRARWVCWPERRKRAWCMPAPSLFKQAIASRLPAGVRPQGYRRLGAPPSATQPQLPHQPRRLLAGGQPGNVQLDVTLVFICANEEAPLAQVRPLAISPKRLPASLPRGGHILSLLASCTRPSSRPAPVGCGTALITGPDGRQRPRKQAGEGGRPRSG